LGAAAIGTLGQTFHLDGATQKSGILRRELPDLVPAETESTDAPSGTKSTDELLP
jgi:hypothetical protein